MDFGQPRPGPSDIGIPAYEADGSTFRVLFGFGTGPIKGFAVTLSIGLIANMFTAVLFTRMIFDYMLSRAGKVERLSI